MINDKKVNDQIENITKYEWQVLDLKNCGLNKIPEEIFKCNHLVSIDISNDEFCDEEYKNRITVIPDEIAKIRKLKRLNLSNNKIKIISEQITKLENLTHLDLTKNKLTDISGKIVNMPSLKVLNIEDNPFDILPPEIAARGIKSIRNFFKEIEEKDYLYEVKLILVGQGRVGKTCLSKALKFDHYKLDEEDSTEGINVNTWIIPQKEISKYNPKIKRDFQINIWDFGGQEIYHSTHQFFLTKRSIYILVTESRKEDSHDDFFYWLNIIKLLGDESPVIMVMNKCDQPTKELPINEYKETFENIVDFHKISLKEGYEDKLLKFKSAFKKIAANLDHIGNPLPKVWVDIRLEIEQLKLSGKNYIPKTEYLEICKKYFRREKSALYLSEYFHDLGVLLHFQNDIDLKDTVFLNHEWLTTAVYKVLDDHKVIQQQGRFSIDDIERIWSCDDYKFKTRELLSLMKNKKFDLCFELPKGDFLVPRLLPVDEIEHEWKSNPENKKFEFNYKFMPKGILTRLIVKLNADILNNMFWRYGVILQYEDTKAMVREKYFENKITIELTGGHKREYLYNIRKVVNDIHKDYNNIVVKEMIPCNCSHCSTVNNPHFYDFNLIQRYELKDIHEIRCDKSLEMVKVSSLTDDLLRKRLSNEKVIACENRNEEILNSLDIPNVVFLAERDSSSVFIKVKTNIDIYGLRDRDFLLDTEIQRIRKKYPKYFVLDYYCFENYLYHPDNISELELSGFDKEIYKRELINQKNNHKKQIFSVYKNARKSYQEFKVERDNLKDNQKENQIMDYLDSDEIEIFFKSFSIKDYFDKSIIKKYNLKHSELARTNWFKYKILGLLNFEEV